MNRIGPALLIPLGVLLFTVAIIVGIGELLLLMARLMPELGGIHEPLSVLVALLLAAAILAIASLLASRAASSRQDHQS